MWADGAADCTVVKVVVNDRTDGAGDEKVLPSPPPYTPPLPVTVVPVFEYPASDRAVSPFVDSVGAVDLALLPGIFGSDVEACNDCWLAL